MKRSKITCFTIAAIMFTSLGCNTESSEREEDKNNINSKTRNMEMTFLIVWIVVLFIMYDKHTDLLPNILFSCGFSLCIFIFINLIKFYFENS